MPRDPCRQDVPSSTPPRGRPERARQGDTPPQPDRLLTVEEAAAMLGMTRRALYALTARRQIPHRRQGRRLVFMERELQAYIAALDGLTVEEWEEARERRGE